MVPDTIELSTIGSLSCDPWLTVWPGSTIFIILSYFSLLNTGHSWTSWDSKTLFDFHPGSLSVMAPIKYPTLARQKNLTVAKEWVEKFFRSK